eukprot:10275971-Alexandrium_andersonii.AAC.1
MLKSRLGPHASRPDAPQEDPLRASKASIEARAGLHVNSSTELLPVPVKLSMQQHHTRKDLESNRPKVLNGSLKGGNDTAAILPYAEMLVNTKPVLGTVIEKQGDRTARTTIGGELLRKSLTAPLAVPQDSRMSRLCSLMEDVHDEGLQVLLEEPHAPEISHTPHQDMHLGVQDTRPTVEEGKPRAPVGRK